MLMRASLKATRHKEGRPLILAEHLDLSIPDLLTEKADAENERPDITAAVDTQLGLRDAVDEYQHRLIQQVLDAHDGNWSATARQLKVDRANLNRLAQRLGIKT